ncbi:hypothetical protein ISG32_21500 [Diaphorobacter sp. NR2-3-3-1]|nr:hypothetical protein [Diaphorobacter caeni]
MDANGNAHSRTSVPLVQDGDSCPANGYYCEWMPYQKGQAAKTEAAEKNASTAPSTDSEPSQRERLEYALVSGAASCLAEQPHQARQIAAGMKIVLDALHPGEAGAPAPITLPVIDPGPDSLEREIQTKASSAPRVTPADIEAEIVSKHYFTGADGRYGAILNETYVGTELPRDDGGDLEPLEQVTFCVLVLRNGTKVAGINYGAIDHAQHSAERGRQEAYTQAVDKVYELLGFRLRDDLARPVLTDADAAADLAGTPRSDNPSA